MRSFGLTLCLLVSSFGARAEAAEHRLAALEARVKSLEQALSLSGDDLRTLPVAQTSEGNDAVDLVKSH